MKYPKGMGYWQTTHYPIGGEFHRATEDITGLRIIRRFEFYKGCNCEVSNDKGLKFACKESELINE